MTFIHGDHDKGLPRPTTIRKGGAMRYPHDVPTLADGRVTLRAAGPGDARGVWEQCQDPLSQRWTTVPVPYTMADAREFVESAVPRAWRQDEGYTFAVEADDGGAPRFAGSVALRVEGSGRYEVAYGSHPWCRGRGVMEPALRLLLAWGFEDLDARVVVWWANRGNWASRKLAWRLGFSVDGTLRGWLPHRGELCDAWVGTLLPGDPREPRTRWYDVPTVHGDGLLLRALRDQDAARVQEACSDPRTQRWLQQLPAPYTDEHAALFLESRRELLASGRGIAWAVADPGTDLLLASISVFDVAPGHEAEIGFWTHPDARGRGVMTAACGLVARHAFVPEEDGGLGLRRVYAFAAEPNAASRRVLAANGFTATGRDRSGTRLRDGGFVDTIVHDLLVEELHAAPPEPAGGP